MGPARNAWAQWNFDSRVPLFPTNSPGCTLIQCTYVNESSATVRGSLVGSCFRRPKKGCRSAQGFVDCDLLPRRDPGFQKDRIATTVKKQDDVRTWDGPAFVKMERQRKRRVSTETGSVFHVFYIQYL
jgi:hypothetical protein